MCMDAVASAKVRWCTDNSCGGLDCAVDFLFSGLVWLRGHCGLEAWLVACAVLAIRWWLWLVRWFSRGVLPH